MPIEDIFSIQGRGTSYRTYRAGKVKVAKK